MPAHLSRRALLAAGLAAPAAFARGAAPGDPNVHRQLLELAAQRERTRRAKFAAVPLFTRFTSSHQRIVSLIENTGSLTPCTIISFPPRFWNPERSLELARMKSATGVVYSPDVAVSLVPAVCTLMERRKARGSGPCAGMTVGGVVNSADTDPLPSVAMIAPFCGASYAPIFHDRQPWL